MDESVEYATPRGFGIDISKINDRDSLSNINSAFLAALGRMSPYWEHLGSPS